MYKITTFAPDLDPLTGGILVDGSDNFYPSESGGIRAMPTTEAISEALAARCMGSFSFEDLAGSYRTYAGTSTKLYQLTNLSWTDVSLTGDYSSAYRWRFAAWGNTVIATNGTDAVQAQTTSEADFADLAGSPPAAKYVISCHDFVILAHITDDGTSTARQQRVHWSAQGDHTDWTASISTQAGYQDLDDSPGEITGIARLGDAFVVFKETCLYLVTYIGPSLIWQFERIMTVSGCPSHESIVELENGLYYPGLDDFYWFDGSTCRRIGMGVRKWFFDNVDKVYIRKMFASNDYVQRLIMWHFPTTDDGSGYCADCLVYDYQRQRWGRVSGDIEAAVVYNSPGVTYDTISDTFSTYDDIDEPYDSPWWDTRSLLFGVFDSDHKLARYSGTPGTTTLITGDMGNLQSYSRLSRLYPYYIVEPTTSSITPRTKVQLFDTATEGTAATVSDTGKVDMIATGKFISTKFTNTGDFEITGFDVVINQMSSR